MRVDIEQLKAFLTQPNRRRPIPPRIIHHPRTGERSQVAREIEEGVKAMLSGQSFDPARLAKLRELNHQEQIQRAERQAANAAKLRSAPVTKAEFRRRLEEKRKARDLLGLIPPPFIPEQVTLEQPFLIWQLPNPQLDIFVGQQIAPWDSFVKVNVDTASDSEGTSFVFYFYWQNATPAYALIDVNTSLILNGYCYISAAPAVLFGNSVYLDLNASLTLMEWWNQPPTAIYAQNEYIVALNAETEGSFDFGSPKTASIPFDFAGFDLSYSMMAVPPESVVVIEVAFELSYGFDGGESNISEVIQADFNTKDRLVMCPFVELAVLTQAA